MKLYSGTVTAMNLEYSKDAIKAIKSLDKPMRDRMLTAINGLLKTPPEGDIKTMQGNRTDYRLRVGKYRVIFHIDGETVRIDDVGARGDIYK